MMPLSNQQNSETKRHKLMVLTFSKVLDGRKQPIRGLWIRGTRYYARLNVENPNHRHQKEPARAFD